MGRPLKYGDEPSKSADRVDALRARTKEAGLSRVEFMVDTTTKSSVQALAQAQGVSSGVLGAYLLEEGLKVYLANNPEATFSPVAPVLQPEPVAPQSVTDFFNRRKESYKGDSNG